MFIYESSLMIGQFYRAVGELKRKNKATHLFDCCRNLLPTRQMDAKADTLAIQTVKLEKAVGGDHLNFCWLGDGLQNSH